MEGGGAVGKGLGSGCPQASGGLRMALVHRLGLLPGLPFFSLLPACEWLPCGFFKTLAELKLNFIIGKMGVMISILLGDSVNL